jgi:hypothetical protein
MLIATHIGMQSGTPVVCQNCDKIAQLENGTLSPMAEEQQEAIKQTAAYKTFIEPASDIAYRLRMAQKARWN